MSLHFYLLVFLLAGSLHFGAAHNWSRIQFPQNKDIGYNAECRINHNGLAGNCRKLSECISAQIILENDRIHPSLCFFDRYEPVICCPKLQMHGSENGSQNKSKIISTSGNTSGNTPGGKPPVSTFGNNSKIVSQNETNKNIQQMRIIQEECIRQYTDKEDLFHITVVGGEDAEPGEFPYMAAIGWNHSDGRIDYNCGGFMITPVFVLTAAHCTSLAGVPPNVVRTGGNNLSTEPITNSIISIDSIHKHPEYVRTNSYNDIAIIKLSQASPDDIACLWPTHSTEDYEEITAIGYGHLKFGGRRSDQLQKVKLKLFSNPECGNFYSPSIELQNGIIDSQICAGDLDGVRDTCQGDSGGPIIANRTIKGTSVPFVLGVTSFGQGCAGGVPSIYTRISSYLDWIETTIYNINLKS